MLTVKQAGDLLHALATVHQLENPRESYPAALDAVMSAAANADLVAAYSVRGPTEERARLAARAEEHRPAPASVRELGDKVDRLTKEYMAAHGTQDYAAALNAVLAGPANAALKAAYAYAHIG